MCLHLQVTLVRSKDPKDPKNVAAVSEAAKAIIARLKANNAGARLRADLAPDDEDVSFSMDDIGGEPQSAGCAPFEPSAVFSAGNSNFCSYSKAIAMYSD
eukprot:scaffold92446_cov30-Prasinocladus_malaysianus.AAC.1